MTARERLHGFEGRSVEDMLKRNDLPPQLQRQFLKFRKQRWQDNLDACHGTCLLKAPPRAALVAAALQKFNGERYDLERFVIMPNHVHVLVQMRPGWPLKAQCTSWLRFTGRQINELRGKVGECWQSEVFDHVVRSVEQLSYLRQYIQENPRKAKLGPGQYLFWAHGDSG